MCAMIHQSTKMTCRLIIQDFRIAWRLRLRGIFHKKEWTQKQTATSCCRHKSVAANLRITVTTDPLVLRGGTFCMSRASGAMARIVGCSLRTATTRRRTRARASALACICYINFMKYCFALPIGKK